MSGAAGGPAGAHLVSARCAGAASCWTISPPPWGRCHVRYSGEGDPERAGFVRPRFRPDPACRMPRPAGLVTGHRRRRADGVGASPRRRAHPIDRSVDAGEPMAPADLGLRLSTAHPDQSTASEGGQRAEAERVDARRAARRGRPASERHHGDAEQKRGEGEEKGAVHGNGLSRMVFVRAPCRSNARAVALEGRCEGEIVSRDHVCVSTSFIGVSS